MSLESAVCSLQDAQAALGPHSPFAEDSRLQTPDSQSFRNFNLSVGATDAFLQAVADDGPFELRHPQTGKVVRTVSAAALMERIVEAAWRTGDPGLVFLDAINRANPTPQAGAIEATNPCGEVPLLPYEACNLGSINLAHMTRVEHGGPQAGGYRFVVDWKRLQRTARAATRFLDDVIEVGKWPAPQIEQAVHGNRKVGLGVMGFADLLTLLEVPYASDEAVELAERLMKTIHGEAMHASEEMAKERGVFPNWERSVHAQQGRRLRNATVCSIAPTGTIGIIADTSASIEPLFALAYRREHVLDEETLDELNPLFVRYARRHGFHSDELIRELRRGRSLADVPHVPAKARELFRTALEIAPHDHLRIQAAFQRHVDNAVSKTINLPESATREDIAALYRRAWELGLKGVTIYRYGSKGQQVLNLGEHERPEQHEHFARCDPGACKS